MKRLLLLSLLSLSIFCTYAQTDGKETTDTIRTTFPIEKWEYKTIYVHNTHPNARQGEVEFKSHKDSESLDKYGSEGWEYWVDGVKTAWVDSQTSTLRVSNARVDESTMMSGAWQWKEFGGLGLKYIGN